MGLRSLILILFALFISGALQAGQLQPIAVSNPINPAEVRGQCLDAFDRAYADKEAYESQPQVGLKCAFNLKGDQAADMQNYFLNMCKDIIEKKAGSGSPTVDIPENLLSGLFDTAYGAVLRKSECFQSAMSDFAIIQDQQSGSSQSASAASRDGCYAFLGCQK